MAFSRAICRDGEPQLLSPLVEAAGPRAQSAYPELLQSEGVSEAMQMVVLRQARRPAVFGANRQKDTGALTDDELTIMRLLLPHIRRAVTISDILDMKKLEAHALAPRSTAVPSARWEGAACAPSSPARHPIA